MKTDGNQSIDVSYTPGGHLISKGLTKREYFAALAMQGILSLGGETPLVLDARSAVEAADALIEELNGAENE
jgi:hypothetical protein